MRILKAALVVLSVAATGLILASPAGATTPILKHGNDWARTYYVNDDIISVHDGENDGHVVWADYYVSTGDLYRVTDATGPNNGGATHDWTQTPYWITAFRVCESDGGGCTGWRYSDGLGGNSVESGKS